MGTLAYLAGGGHPSCRAPPSSVRPSPSLTPARATADPSAANTAAARGKLGGLPDAHSQRGLAESKAEHRHRAGGAGLPPRPAEWPTGGSDHASNSARSILLSLGA